MREMLLTDIVFDSEHIKDWDYVIVDKFGHMRIWYKPKTTDPKNGFEFFVTQWVRGGESSNIYTDDAEVACLFKGHAYFDGIRHMWAGHEDEDDNIDVYYYYTDANEFVWIFQALRKLEEKYCNPDALAQETNQPR